MVTDDYHNELTALFCAGLKGNRVAYTNFLENITPLLRRIVSKRMARADIEDVVQEILISVHKARHTYDGERPIVPWLMAIARFRISDHLRKYYAQMRHLTTDINALADMLADVTESSENNESLQVLLEDVPEKHKQILTMMHVEGYTAKETGQKLNMNESAVKVAAHRAIKKIREKFGT